MTRQLFQRQVGLSLVELMIAITLSLLLIGGVLQIVLASKQTYSSASALSRVQENGRFALGILTEDIRNAGYQGQCIGTPTSHLTSTDEGRWTLTDPILGWNNGDLPGYSSMTDVQSLASGTDAIFIKFAAGGPDLAGKSTNTPGTALTTVDPENTSTEKSANILQGAVALVSNALFCELFRNGSTSNATSVSQNPAGNWGMPYNSGEIDVLPLQNSLYYIKANASGIPSLFRQRLSVASNAPAWVTEELVEGIQDMQITYGIAGANQQVTQYQTADNVTNWDSVVSVHVELLAISPETNVAPQNPTLSFNGGTVTLANRRLGQVFSTTIGIRNRLP